MNDSKLIKLVDAGDFICIERGKLIYRPAKRAVRSYSRVNDRRNLVAEVLRAVGQTGYEYCGYSTGNYGPGGYSGVSLQFLNLVTSESAYVVFNAKLERQRNTRSGKKGQRLPDGRFIVGRKSAFTKFWLNCGLELPRSLTSFHDYMGKLSQVFIMGEVIANEKLDKSTLRPISVTYEEIKAAIQHPEVTDSFLTGAGQLPVSSRITTSDNQTSKVSFINRFRQNRTTGHFNHDQSHQGGAVIHSLKDSNINDSKGVDEWLEEYGFGNDPYF